LKLPRVSGKEAVDTLVRAGFVVHRIRGSHYILKDPQTGHRVTVPYHRQELAPKTPHSILKQAGIPAEKFADLM
jgi:predicted RNA binding protein YcfA (HicA-like mRNA interferase family)